MYIYCICTENSAYGWQLSDVTSFNNSAFTAYGSVVVFFTVYFLSYFSRSVCSVQVQTVFSLFTHVNNERLMQVNIEMWKHVLSL